MTTAKQLKLAYVVARSSVFCFVQLKQFFPQFEVILKHLHDLYTTLKGQWLHPEKLSHVNLMCNLIALNCTLSNAGIFCADCQSIVDYFRIPNCPGITHLAMLQKVYK